MALVQPQRTTRLAREPCAAMVCQVDGCNMDLNSLKEYHQRYKICEFHLKVDYIVKDGAPQRFCQQCGRFHLLEAFDENRRSCRERLMKHNARRRRKGQAGVSAEDPGSAEGGEEVAELKSASPSAQGEHGHASPLKHQNPNPAKQQTKRKKKLDTLLANSYMLTTHASVPSQAWSEGTETTEMDSESYLDSKESLEHFFMAAPGFASGPSSNCSSGRSSFSLAAARTLRERFVGRSASQGSINPQTRFSQASKLGSGLARQVSLPPDVPVLFPDPTLLCGPSSSPGSFEGHPLEGAMVNAQQDQQHQQLLGRLHKPSPPQWDGNFAPASWSGSGQLHLSGDYNTFDVPLHLASHNQREQLMYANQQNRPPARQLSNASSHMSALSLSTLDPNNGGSNWGASIGIAPPNSEMFAMGLHQGLVSELGGRVCSRGPLAAQHTIPDQLEALELEAIWESINSDEMLGPSVDFLQPPALSAGRAAGSQLGPMMSQFRQQQLNTMPYGKGGMDGLVLEPPYLAGGDAYLMSTAPAVLQTAPEMPVDGMLPGFGSWMAG